MEITTTDGGQAFPVSNFSTAMPGTVEEGMRMARGMTLRQYYAGQLMQSELMTCGVPGEACAALAQRAADMRMDPMDVMAANAMEGADALIRASAIPPQRIEQPFDPAVLTSGECEAMERLTWWNGFGDLPAEIQARATKTAEYLKAVGEDDGIPF